jgi:hypothetical protein
VSKADPNNLKHYHDKGEQDYSKNEFNAPNETLIHQFDRREYEQDQNAAYRKGWENAKSQDKKAK